ncbi:VOC family protein [Enterococcus sp. BWR-S5]|uniref:VOC family protein n=1 Tax=Enterococcus sp. BWR-S5 TaxID=2787714 RepID=UPI0019210F46|nr:VOC family protein [Enterococcus sp. BWR-S5]MBL1225276.1 glyoxalase [Enterococcus sp. BWR-S5]
MTTSFYPVLMSATIEETSKFFIDLFHFEVTYTSEWYVSLKNKQGFELAVIDSTHETIPKKYQANCKGIILNFEVEDVDSVYEELQKTEAKILMPIKDEAFGQRHFMIESPDELIIDVIQNIPPSEEYLESYAAEENEHA